MLNSRKRKLGVVSAPPEDVINQNIKRSGDVINRESRGACRDITCTDLIEKTKVVNDAVHGHFELPLLLFKFIDTPQFQRLRHIKQLGTMDLVFPGATHNRFAHCLGVAHLAGRMCKSLWKRQPGLGITNIDVLCVQIAGLCHDLGHGPLSHFFDGLFMPKARPEYPWQHEQGSVSMFDHLIEENNLLPILQSCGFTSEDINFVKELVFGPLKNDLSDEWSYKGRTRDKSFLYEIVANKRTGIDVDKWDYFARDCYHLGISNNFDYKRFMKFARVVTVDGNLQICTRDKEVSTLYDMFHTRNSLHRRAYQHKTVKIIDIMLRDALLKANDHLFIEGRNGNKLKLCECVDDMVAYTKLNDNIFTLIELSPDEALAEAKALINRVHKRDLYQLVGQTILLKDIEKRDCTWLCTGILNMMEITDLSETEFDVHIIEFNYGMKDKNPIDQVRFYNKHKPSVARKLKKNQVSQMLPERFAEQHMRFYYKGYDTEIFKEAKRAFKSWCDSKNCSTVDVHNPELTGHVDEK